METASGAATWIKVAEPGALDGRPLTQVQAGDRTLALANSNGRVTALDDRCPHFGASLSDGQIEDGKVICPWHGREYDLQTGACHFFESVSAYPVAVRADGVYVLVPA